jgi:peptide deformylase
MRTLRTAGDPILKIKCIDVTSFDDNLYQLVKDMRRIMQENHGVGLAAPQIGEALRVIVVQRQRTKGTYAVVNPVITKSSCSTSVLAEGCLSYPGISKEISRPNTVFIIGKDINGRVISIRADGLEARIFSHEIDHLDGKCKVGE